MNTLRAQASRLNRAGFEPALVQCQPKLTTVEVSTVLREQAAESDYLPPEGHREHTKHSNLGGNCVDIGPLTRGRPVPASETVSGSIDPKSFKL